MTQLKQLKFDDDATVVVVCRDSHVFSNVTALDFQDGGVMFDQTGGNGPGSQRLFIPYDFIQSINEDLP